MSKLTHVGVELLNTLKARKAETEAEKTSALEEEAEGWAKERIVKLYIELKKAGMGDGLRIHSLADKKLDKGDELKIAALNKALGIDIMSKAEIRNFAFAGEPTDWIVEIIVRDLLKLLEDASQA